jgi:hypothetical protein
MHNAGVCVAYIYENALSSGRDQIQMVVNHALNEDWLEKHREKVQQGYRVHRFEKAKYSGMPPVGYVMEYQPAYNPLKRSLEPVETGRLIPNLEVQPRIGYGETYTRADLIRLIRRLYVSGRFGDRSLAPYLNAQGYRNKEGRLLTGASIRHILCNPTYAGYLAWNIKKRRLAHEEVELIEGPHEPLWSRELWAQIKAVRIRLRKGAPGNRRRHVYPFRGLVTCDRCGTKMYGEPHRGVSYMACSTQRSTHRCAERAVQSAQLEAQVGEWLRSLKLPDGQADIAKMQRGLVAADHERPGIDRGKLDGQLSRLTTLMSSGVSLARSTSGGSVNWTPG